MTRSKYSFMLALFGLFAAVIAGCADEVERTVPLTMEEIAAEGRLDLANGNDAAAAGEFALSVSADGQTSFLFTNEIVDHASDGTGGTSVKAYPFGRTLGAAGASSALAFGNHADQGMVDGTLLMKAYSPSKRYTCFLHLSADGASRYAIVYDSISNTWRAPVKVWENSSAATAINIATWTRGTGVHTVPARITISNSGLLSIFTLADDAQGDPHLYVTQYELGSSSFLRGPSRITNDYAQPNDAANSLEDVRVVASIAGMIGVVYSTNDFFDASAYARVLRFAFYDIANDQWSAPVRVDNSVNDNFIPVGFDSLVLGGNDNFVIDANRRHFQLVFWQIEGNAPGARTRLYSRRLDTASVFTFSPPAIIDVLEAGETLDLSLTPDIHFGPTQHSIVTFRQRETAGRTIQSLYGSFATDQLVPSSLRTARLDGLSTAQAGNDGALSRDARVWFNADEDALITFVLRDGNDDEEIYRALYESESASIGFTAAAPVDGAFDDVLSNPSFEANPVSTRDKTIVSSTFTGWDSTGRALLVWNARLSDSVSGDTLETRVYVRMLSGLVADGNEFRIDNLSNNDLVDGSLIVRAQANPRTLEGYDAVQDAVDPDYLPGGGNGKVVVGFMQPEAFGSFEANRAYLWDFLPSSESLLSADPWEVPLEGWIDSIDFISPGVANGAVLVGYSHNGVAYFSRRVGVNWSAPVRYTNPLLLARNGGVLFTDGYTSEVLDTQTNLRGGSYAFAIEQGSDGVSQRLFSAKLR